MVTARRLHRLAWKLPEFETRDPKNKNVLGVPSAFRKVERHERITVDRRLPPMTDVLGGGGSRSVGLRAAPNGRFRLSDTRKAVHEPA